LRKPLANQGGQSRLRHRDADTHQEGHRKQNPDRGTDSASGGGKRDHDKAQQETSTSPNAGDKHGAEYGGGREQHKGQACKDAYRCLVEMKRTVDRRQNGGNGEDRQSQAIGGEPEQGQVQPEAATEFD
jgi:hypothetical protein